MIDMEAKGLVYCCQRNVGKSGGYMPFFSAQCRLSKEDKTMANTHGAPRGTMMAGSGADPKECRRISLRTSAVIVLFFCMLIAWGGVVGVVAAAETAAAGNIEIYGVKANGADTELDLSGHEIADVYELKKQLSAFLNLRRVNLDNCGLSTEDMRILLRSFPSVDFFWTFTMYDIPVSSTDTKVDLGAKRVGDIDTLIKYLDCLPNLKQFDMYKSKLREKQIWTLAERYPNIRFGWTLSICNISVRTDAIAYSMHTRLKPHYKSEDFRLLRFCPDLLAIDLGHNDITDISFLKNFPKLKILILAVNPITDISTLADLNDLEYVELFMNQITDISPLANKKKLLDLNLCRNKVKDITPLLSCTSLERVWISRNAFGEEEQAVLKEGLPNCKFNFTVYSSTDEGWREHKRYFVMRDILNNGVYKDWE